MSPCTICLSPINKATVEENSVPGTYSTACGHIYHAVCIGNWLRTREEASCPCCNKIIQKGDMRRLYMDNDGGNVDDKSGLLEKDLDEIKCILETFVFKIEATPNPKLTIDNISGRIPPNGLDQHDVFHKVTHLATVVAAVNNLMGSSAMTMHDAELSMFHAPPTMLSFDLGLMDGENQAFILPIIDHALMMKRLQILNIHYDGDGYRENFNNLNTNVKGFLLSKGNSLVVLKKADGQWFAHNSALLSTVMVGVDEILTLFDEEEGDDKVFIVTPMGV